MTPDRNSRLKVVWVRNVSGVVTAKSAMKKIHR
jgi:hypothetical protein